MAGRVQFWSLSDKIEVIDAREIDFDAEEFSEAAGLGWALSVCPPGEHVTLHSAECGIDSSPDRECSCVPLTLVTGAKA